MLRGSIKLLPEVGALVPKQIHMCYDEFVKVWFKGNQIEMPYRIPREKFPIDDLRSCLCGLFGAPCLEFPTISQQEDAVMQS